MKNQTGITIEEVKSIAKLANLPIDQKQIAKLKKDLEATFEYINKIQSLDTSSTQETSQVTGLESVFREDVVDKKRTLSQFQALSNAKSTYKGYFKVKAIFDEE